MTKPLTELLKEVEPRFTAQQNKLVDRKSYDRMKQVAIALSEALEKYVVRGNMPRPPCVSFGLPAELALAQATKILEGEE